MIETNTQDRIFTDDNPHQVKIRYMTPKEIRETRKNILSSLFKGRKEINRRIK